MGADTGEVLDDVVDLVVLDGGEHVPEALGVHSADLVGAGGGVELVDDLEVGVALDVDGELAALAPDEEEGGI